LRRLVSPAAGGSTGSADEQEPGSSAEGMRKPAITRNVADSRWDRVTKTRRLGGPGPEERKRPLQMTRWGVRFLIAATLSLSLTAVPVQAARPEIITYVVDTQFDADPDHVCAFAISGRSQGLVRVSTFFDASGNVRREIASFHLVVTYTNVSTGKAVTSPSIGPDILPVYKNGGMIGASIGILTRIVVPGKGAVILNAGRIVYNFENGDTFFQAGPKSDLFPALCDILSSP
jgi:hypothetical protein